MIRAKRVYGDPSAEDGYRVLVDRLWPRGLSKEKAAIDLWFKEIAPSGELREWFGHRPERFDEFTQRYRRELARHPEMVSRLRSLEAEHGTLTLLYAAHDELHNQAVVLAEVVSSEPVRT
jgi:uncharacterized protein YeaO (DUF488 family)